MGRRPRVEYNGAVYHVIQRGSNREYIFDQDEDKKCFLDLLKTISCDLGAVVFAYVIMSNHYHLVLRTDDAPLSKIMHRLNSLYGKYYNRTHSRTGPVYEGRYKAIPIQDNRYLAAVIRYVHRNPVVAKMCSRVADYRWSSDGAYRYGKTSFIDTAPLLGYLHNDHVLAVKAYCKFMEEEDNGDYEKIAFIGDEAFAMIAEPVKKTIIRTRLDELLAQTGVPFEDISLIKSGSRQRRLMPYKKALVLLAREHGYTFAEIGRFLNISSTAAEKLV